MTNRTIISNDLPSITVLTHGLSCDASVWSNDGSYFSYGEESLPPNPYRKGYEFLGWYKEPECINICDFENDIVPSKEYDKNGDYILKEIKLYAKWGKE